MKRVFIAGCSPINRYSKRTNNSEPHLILKKIEVFINPVIRYSSDTEESEETCLSLADVI
jgi:peptide deformylase